MIGIQTDVARVAELSEVNRLMKLDTKPWYRKPNLRRLYFFLIPSALGCEMTSGYDGSILNGLQAVGPWLSCMSGIPFPSTPSLDENLSLMTVYLLQTLEIQEEHYLVS